MKVKQLIYTSWKNGNSTRKGFMVYSKSEGVSPEDENAITSAMRYTTLPSLPYTPTRDEIENLFPRNCSYFRLPSGKYCFAQSSYLGKDYSGRTGNYIIHAYISDSAPDFNTFNLIKSDVFRRAMTEEELEADSNPPALPEVEITVPDNPDDEVLLQQFFTPEKKEKLRFFVEAVLAGVAIKKTVYAFDEQPALAMWYKALYYCLPKSLLPQVTFSTYSCYVPNDITIACVKEGGIFNYDINLAMGNLVYNFRDNKINDKITVSEYTQKVVDEFYLSPMRAAAFASSVDKYMGQANGNLHLAISLSKFYAGGYEQFATPEALKEVFGCITSSKEVPAAQLGDIIGNIITSNELFDYTVNADMFRYVMQNGSEVFRYAIISGYSEKRFSVDIPVSSYEGEYQSLVNGAPFEWKEYLTYVNKTSGKDKLASAYSVTSFAAYAVVATVLDYGTDTEADGKLVAGYARTIAALSDLSLCKIFFARLKNKGAMLNVAREITADYGLFDKSSYSHSFEVLEIIDIPEITSRVCAFLIGSFSDDSNFCACAEKFFAANPAAYAQMEKLSADDFVIKTFLEDMITARFLGSAPDDAALDNFYGSYFNRSAQMRDVFYQGLKLRLSAEQLYAGRAKLAINWYNKISSSNAQSAVIMRIAGEVIFDGNEYIAFAKFYKENTADIDSFVRACRGSGIALDYSNYSAATLAGRIRAAANLNKKNYKKDDFVAAVLKDGLLSGSNAAVGKIIAENHLEDIFALYETVLSSEEDVNSANAAFVNNVFAPLAEAAAARQNAAFCSCFGARINKLKWVSSLYCVYALAAYASTPANANGALAFTMDEYFKGMPKKKIEKLYSEMSSQLDVKIPAEVKTYIENKINTSENIGFFARLFGKK